MFGDTNSCPSGERCPQALDGRKVRVQDSEFILATKNTDTVAKLIAETASGTTASIFQVLSGANGERPRLYRNNEDEHNAMVEI